MTFPVPICVKCGDILTEPGVIVLSPPDSTGMVRKVHICVPCFEPMVFGWLLARMGVDLDADAAVGEATIAARETE